MARYQDDYGGFAHDRGRRGEKVGRGSRHSMRCCSCGTLRYVLKKELTRAAPPRCMACGGALEETIAARKHEGLKPASPPQRVPRRRCPACGVAIDGNVELRNHLVASFDCARYHLAERQLPEWKQSGIFLIPGSMYIEKYASGRWGVFAVGVEKNGRVHVPLLICQSKTRQDARDWLYSEYGPVELAR